MILKKAKEIGTKFKLDKCFFVQTQVKVLGLEVTPGKIRTDPSKVKALAHWPRPSKLGDPESFLGAVIFLKTFLGPRLSVITRPLRQLIKPKLITRDLKKELAGLPDVRDSIKDVDCEGSSIPNFEVMDPTFLAGGRSGCLHWSKLVEESFS